MVNKTITLQLLTTTRSETTGATIEKWVTVDTIKGQTSEINTFETVKGVRVYSKKTIILTKYKDITPENNRLIIDGVFYAINNVTPGVWTVVNARGLETC